VRIPPADLAPRAVASAAENDIPPAIAHNGRMASLCIDNVTIRETAS